MKRSVYGISVRGMSHIREGLPCQDSCRVEIPDPESRDGIITAAAADGHGSRACPYSGEGSALAVYVFCEVIRDLLSSCGEDTDALRTFLNREGDTTVARNIEIRWRRLVRRAFRRHRREQPRKIQGKMFTDIASLYGTTLLGVLICTDWLFAFQIGDGDITWTDGTTAVPVVDAVRFLGTETYSLSEKNAWKRAVTCVRSRDSGKEGLYLLTTDGFANSHRSVAEMEKSCIGYLEMIRTHGFEAVAGSLEDWLAETSAEGCGDDVTAVLVYQPGTPAESGEETCGRTDTITED